MPFNLLILPLLGGFIFFSHWNRTAFFAKRQDKERLLFYSSLHGAAFLGLSFLFSTIIPHIDFLTDIRKWWAYNTPAIPFSGISSFAFFLGVASQFVLNKMWPFQRHWSPEREIRRVIQAYGTELEKLLHKSMIQGKLIQLTLRSGKVYVGRVAISIMPKQNEDFVLLPSKSGYRDDKRRLVLTTDYDWTYERLAESEENYLDIIADFGVVVPIADILTASLYREEIHHRYFAAERPPGEPLASKTVASVKMRNARKNKSER